MQGSRLKVEGFTNGSSEAGSRPSSFEQRLAAGTHRGAINALAAAGGKPALAFNICEAFFQSGSVAPSAVHSVASLEILLHQLQDQRWQVKLW